MLLYYLNVKNGVNIKKCTVFLQLILYTKKLRLQECDEKKYVHLMIEVTLLSYYTPSSPRR